MFIPDPKSEFFFHPGSRIPIKEFKHYNPNNCFSTLENMVRIVHPESRIPDPDPDFLPIPDSGVKKAPDPGSRIRNTP
jgi:hypothetical protein